MSEPELKQITDDELKQMLIKIANADMAEGASIYDHPCSVAIRKIEKLTDALLAFKTRYSLSPWIIKEVDDSLGL